MAAPSLPDSQFMYLLDPNRDGNMSLREYHDVERDLKTTQVSYESAQDSRAQYVAQQLEKLESFRPDFMKGNFSYFRKVAFGLTPPASTDFLSQWVAMDANGNGELTFCEYVDAIVGLAGRSADCDPANSMSTMRMTTQKQNVGGKIMEVLQILIPEIMVTQADGSQVPAVIYALKDGTFLASNLLTSIDPNMDLLSTDETATGELEALLRAQSEEVLEGVKKVSSHMLANDSDNAGMYSLQTNDMQALQDSGKYLIPRYLQIGFAGSDYFVLDPSKQTVMSYQFSM